MADFYIRLNPHGPCKIAKCKGRTKINQPCKLCTRHPAHLCYHHLLKKDRHQVPGILNQIHNNRDKLISGMEGGTPQILTTPKTFLLLDTAMSLIPVNRKFSFIDIGHGDTRVACMALALGADSIGGVEMNKYADHLSPQKHAAKMLVIAGGDIQRAKQMYANFHWGKNVLNVTTLESVIPNIKNVIIMYSFDFGMGWNPRRHWLTMAYKDKRVHVIITANQQRNKVSTLLSKANRFTLASQLTVSISGSSEGKSMLIFTRN